jgi:hypothetical protein
MGIRRWEAKELICTNLKLLPPCPSRRHCVTVCVTGTGTGAPKSVPFHFIQLVFSSRKEVVCIP